MIRAMYGDTARTSVSVGKTSSVNERDGGKHVEHTRPEQEHEHDADDELGQCGDPEDGERDRVIERAVTPARGDHAEQDRQRHAEQRS